MLHVIEFADNGHIKRENVWIERVAVIRQRILGSRVRRAPTPRLDNKQGADVGMFDTITVETGLPDGASNQVAFQTKDFGAALREFRITPQGILEMRDEVWHPFGHHGLVTFYDRDRVYTAKFSRGRLIGIRSGNPDAWICADESIDPWEVLEHVQTALENLEFDTDLTVRFRNYIIRALDECPGTRVETNPSHSG